MTNTTPNSPQTAQEEVITREAGDRDAWHCICNNTPGDGGFYPCNKEGNEVEPVVGWEGLYVCADCGRIIDPDTLQVVGRNPKPKFLD